MRWADLRPIAKTICTPAELTALDLAALGLSQRTIARDLGISGSAVRSRLESATRKLQAAKEKAA